MEKTLFLMQGAPGSGKSTVAWLLESSLTIRGDVRTFSADNYWYDADGNYNFPSRDDSEYFAKLARAHRETMKMTLDAMKEGTPFIIVDNTNTLHEHVEPYLGLAHMFEYEVQTIRVDPGIDKCIERQKQRPSDRRVPDETVRRMYERMEPLVPEKKYRK